MKTYLEPAMSDAEDLDSCETKTEVSKFAAPANGNIPKNFRPLGSNEMVVVGDFILNNNHEFEPWEGPGGFRADSFVMAVYRQDSRRPAANPAIALAKSS